MSRASDFTIKITESSAKVISIIRSSQKDKNNYVKPGYGYSISEEDMTDADAQEYYREHKKCPSGFHFENGSCNKIKDTLNSASSAEELGKSLVKSTQKTGD